MSSRTTINGLSDDYDRVPQRLKKQISTVFEVEGNKVGFKSQLKKHKAGALLRRWFGDLWRAINFSGKVVKTISR